MKIRSYYEKNYSGRIIFSMRGDGICAKVNRDNGAAL
jgi:hypothetical protein